MTEIIKQIQKEINSLYCEMGFISRTEVNNIFAKYYQIIKEETKENNNKKVYIAVVQENEWDEEPFNIGIFSTKEKAKNAILNWVNHKEDTPFLSLKIYDMQDNPKYITSIEEWDIE